MGKLRLLFLPLDYFNPSQYKKRVCCIIITKRFYTTLDVLFNNSFKNWRPFQIPKRCFFISYSWMNRKNWYYDFTLGKRGNFYNFLIGHLFHNFFRDIFSLLFVVMYLEDIGSVLKFFGGFMHMRINQRSLCVCSNCSNPEGCEPSTESTLGGLNPYDLRI